MGRCRNEVRAAIAPPLAPGGARNAAGPRTGRNGRPFRLVLLLAAVACLAAMVPDSAALADVGSQPGDLVLSLASGALNSTPSWSTTDGCPVGYQGSAQLAEFSYPGGQLESLISSVVQGTTNPDTTDPVAEPFGAGLVDNVGALLAVAGLSASAPGTVEWAVACWSGLSGTGSAEYEQSTFVSIAAGATTYTSSSTPGPVSPSTGTTTTLTASPNPAAAGASVILTATESAADDSNPPGSVQFEVNGTDIGAAVEVNASGVAMTSTTFATSALMSLAAVFTPTSSGYASSTGTASEVVTQSAGTVPVQVGVPVPVVVTIPAAGTPPTTTIPSGTTAPLTQSGNAASGPLPAITVSSSLNTLPGWSITGQESAFTSPGVAYTIPGDQLGWVPGPATPSPLPAGVTLGPAVAPGTDPGGLGDTGGVLAQAVPGSGYGTFTFGATFTLNIPPAAPPGTYTGTLTITFLEVGP
jgi:Bacterial Ig-like domain (group 3)